MSSMIADYPKILLVDDNKENLLLFKKMMDDLNLNIFVALSGEKALVLAQKYNFDLVVLETKIADSDGFKVCRQIKEIKEYSNTPVLFVSSLHAVEDKVKAFESGGADYLVKPLYPSEAKARVLAHLQHQILTKKLNELLKQSYHELYNPLAVINSSVDLFRMKHGENRYIDAVSAASRTLEVIYQDFSHSFSSSHEAPVVLDLKQLITKRILYFDLMAKTKDLEFSLKTSDQSSNVYMKENELLRIVDNTLSNAVKYAFEKTTIYVEITLEKDKVSFLCTNMGSQIRDTKSIFNHGYREASHQIGMGIGLGLVASICQHNEIKYEVVSEKNKTTFHYFFKSHDFGQKKIFF